MLFNQRYNLSAGFSYIEDAIYGKAPSIHLNSRYNGNRWSVFANGSWFNYTAVENRSNLFTFELGILVPLPSSTLNPAKKGILKAFVYYDQNQNGQYDEGDQPASDYLVRINSIAFRTDKDGNLEYRNIPYEKYMLKQVIQKGWYYDDREIMVSSRNSLVEIPLHKNGVMSGSLRYHFDGRKSVGIDARLSSIVVGLYQKDNLVQHVYTDDEGKFIAFLVTGSYKLKVMPESLSPGTWVEDIPGEFEIVAGEKVDVPEILIQIKEKKTNIKKFGNQN